MSPREEVCRLRPCDLDRSGDVWTYIPRSHKTEHHARQRRIFIGPRAQDILRPFLLRPTETECFSPREARRNADGESHTRRRGHGSRGRRYSTDSYRRAIVRACPASWRCGLVSQPTPHSIATEIRSRFGLEASQTVLGHAQANVTEIYAERDFEHAKRVIKEVG